MPSLSHAPRKRADNAPKRRHWSDVEGRSCPSDGINGGSLKVSTHVSGCESSDAFFPECPAKSRMTESPAPVTALRSSASCTRRHPSKQCLHQLNPHRIQLALELFPGASIFHCSSASRTLEAMSSSYAVYIITSSSPAQTMLGKAMPPASPFSPETFKASISGCGRIRHLLPHRRRRVLPHLPLPPLGAVCQREDRALVYPAGPRPIPEARQP